MSTMPNSALLLMDFQNVIVSRFVDDPEFINRVQNVIQVAREAAIPIIYVVVKFREGFPEVSPRNKAFSMLKSGTMPLSEGNAAVEIHEAFAPKSDDVVVTKRRVGAFSGSDLEVVLRAKGIEHLILTGLSTSGVVLSTLRVAADKDYQITVLADCCGDKDPEVHRVLTEKVFPMQADVTTAKEWIQKSATLAALQN